MAEREQSDLPTARTKVRIIADAQSAGLLLYGDGNSTFDLAFAPGLNNDHLQTEAAYRGLRLLDVILHEAWIVRIHEERNPMAPGRTSCSSSSRLATSSTPENVDARDVRFWTTKAGHETGTDRVGGGREHDRDRLRCPYRRPDSDIAGARTDDGNLPVDEVGRHGMQPVKLAIGPAVFDDNIAALFKAHLGQATVKSSHAVRPLRRRHAVQHADHWHCRLLSART